MGDREGTVREKADGVERRSLVSIAKVQRDVQPEPMNALELLVTSQCLRFSLPICIHFDFSIICVNNYPEHRAIIQNEESTKKEHP